MSGVLGCCLNNVKKANTFLSKKTKAEIKKLSPNARKEIKHLLSCYDGLALAYKLSKSVEKEKPTPIYVKPEELKGE